ncbi:hypothetical protein V8C35DRAFT_298354 [Trichoderma chlorosporum]
MTSTISEAHEKCYLAFENLLSALQQPERDFEEQLPLKNVQEEFDKYKLWAGNMGAAHSGENYKISLDYRLRDALFIQDQILNFLATLDDKITTATSLIRGVRRPFEEDTDEEEFSSSSSSDIEEEGEHHSRLDLSSNSSHGSRALRRTRTSQVDGKDEASSGGTDQTSGTTANLLNLRRIPPQEMPSLYGTIKLTITCLYRMPLRNPAPLDRLNNFQELSSHQDFDIAYVKDKFPQLDSDVATRLGKMITKRRQILRYRENHDKKLDPSPPIQRPTTPITESPHTDERVGPNPVQAESQIAKSQATGSRLILSSKATTYQPKEILLSPMENNNDLEIQYSPSVPKSKSSIASSFAGHDLHVAVPKRPQGIDGKELEWFKCPYCFIINHITTDYEWKKHVFKDIQPYVCTHTDCNLFEHFFDNRDDWNKHEVQSHRVKWFCNTDSHVTYDEKEDFLNHLQADHNMSFDKGRFSQVQQLFAQPSHAIGGICNLCMRNSKKLKSHVSRHLQQIALFALPRTNERDVFTEGGSDDRSSRYGHVGSRTDQNDDHDSQNRDASSKHSGLDQLQSAKLHNMPDLPDDEFETIEIPDSVKKTWSDYTTKFLEARAAKFAEFPDEILGHFAIKLSESRAMNPSETSQFDQIEPRLLHEKDLVFIPDAVQAATSIAHNLNFSEDPTDDADFWDLETIVQTLNPLETKSRLEQIGMSAGFSFQWAFENPSIGLTTWLQNTDSLFWISGRPGSGKSTMMKFLYNDPRTWQFLNKLQRSSRYITANFFFHHRGTAMQKSKEGFLRSVLSQILEQAPLTFLTLQTMFQDLYHDALKAEGIGSLTMDVKELITTFGIEVDVRLESEIKGILACKRLRTSFRSSIIDEMIREKIVEDGKDVESQFMTHMSEIIKLFDNNRLTLESSPIRQIDRKWARSPAFFALLTDWLKIASLPSRLQSLKTLLKEETTVLSSAQDDRNYDDMAKRIIERSSVRQQIRDRVQTWNLNRLTRAITHVVEQKLVDLNICLFIDALDEFDGPLDSFIQFLKDLLDRQHRTRLKFIVSSRPCKAFLEAFGGCPGFQMHEHNDDDIREICLHSIEAIKPAFEIKPKLVEEIVTRTNGMILWAKLMLWDLSGAIYHQAGGNNLEAVLTQILNSLPDDLDCFYYTIIERIPYSYRWEAFGLLEVVTKSREKIDLKEITSILRCLSASDLNDLRNFSEERSTLTATDHSHSLQSYTGGLIEASSDGTSSYLRLLHPTVAEFVKQPQFKNKILGDRCLILKDDGHIFLAKYYFYLCSAQGVDVNFLYHAREAEITTRRSLHGFLRPSSHNTIFTGLFYNHGSKLMPLSMTIAGVAVAGKLSLLLGDIIHKDDATISRASDWFLFILLLALNQGIYESADALAMLEKLVEHGYRPQTDSITILYYLLRSIDQRPHIGDSRPFTELFPPVSLSREQVIEEWAFQVILRFFKDYDFSIPNDIAIVGNSRMNSIRGQDVVKVKILHVCGKKMMEKLLNQGANPNGLASSGLTPIDRWIQVVAQGDLVKEDLRMAFQLIRSLSRFGGRLNTTTRRDWEACSQKMVADLAVQEMEFPGWIHPQSSPGISNKPRRARNWQFWKRL